MPIIHQQLTIHAPPEVCFDLARNIDIHTQSTAKTRERAVSGVTSGLIELGETVTWEAVHFGIKQNLTAKITDYDYPRQFTDEMVSGAFKRFTHTHEFLPAENGTLMIDIFDYTSPLGILGKLADVLFLKRYMRRFLMERNDYLKQLAERQNQS